MTYQYRCESCGERFEVQATIEEKTRGLRTLCPSCGNGSVVQIFGGVSMILARKAECGRDIPSGGCGCGGNGGCVH
jgi:putative FmdB family regulatory protein